MWLPAVAMSFLLSACVYRVDVQQGNFLEEREISEVKEGMTRSQVRFLLGTPVIDNPFDQNRWDYMYTFRAGRSREPERRWVIVYFDGDQVIEIKTDVPVDLE